MVRIGRSGVITGTNPDIMLVLAVVTTTLVVVVGGGGGGGGCDYHLTCDGGGSGGIGGCALLGWYQKW